MKRDLGGIQNEYCRLKDKFLLFRKLDQWALVLSNFLFHNAEWPQIFEIAKEAEDYGQYKSTL